MPRVGQHARAGLAPPGGLAVEVAGRTLGEALACVAWARRGHAIHLRGAVHRARLVIDDTRHAPPSTFLIGALPDPSSPRPAGDDDELNRLAVAPIGVLHRLRDYAYPLSQHVWTARLRTGRRARGQAEPA